MHREGTETLTTCIIISVNFFQIQSPNHKSGNTVYMSLHDNDIFNIFILLVIISLVIIF